MRLLACIPSGDILTTLSPGGGMVDAADLKSVGSNTVRVRVPPWAPRVSVEPAVGENTHLRAGEKTHLPASDATPAF